LIKRKKNKAITFLALAISSFVLLFLFKNNIYEFASKQIQSRNSELHKEQSLYFIDSAFNYTKNKLPYDFTLLEFGAHTCPDCKNMQEVLKEIETWNRYKVKVVFVYVRSNENQFMLEYFGISEIPVQIILDRNAQPIYRHIGFISAEELKGFFNQESN
jgi:thiol-disulfide isomerase/thioredoxin